MIYPVDGGFVISSGGRWLPGIYDTERTARWAFRFSDRQLQDLNDRISHKDGENRPITADDLRTASPEQRSDTGATQNRQNDG